MVRDAGAPVAVETLGGVSEHAADLAWLRERI
jgi:deoxyribonuclease-4